jgi:hypothetical protein
MSTGAATAPRRRRDGAANPRCPSMSCALGLSAVKSTDSIGEGAVGLGMSDMGFVVCGLRSSRGMHVCTSDLLRLQTSFLHASQHMMNHTFQRKETHFQGTWLTATDAIGPPEWTTSPRSSALPHWFGRRVS